MAQNFFHDLSSKTFEDAMLELEQIVKELETGKEPLDQLIEKYETAHNLKNYCLEKLKQAKMKIEKVVENSNGSISLIEETIPE